MNEILLHLGTDALLYSLYTQGKSSGLKGSEYEIRVEILTLPKN